MLGRKGMLGPRVARLLLLALSLPLVAMQSMAAPITNGTFETGDFSNWAVYGATYGAGGFRAVVDNRYPLAPLQGSQSALLVSQGNFRSTGSVCASDAWDMSCPNPTPFSSAPVGGTSIGAGSPGGLNIVSIGQEFDALAGDVIAVDWQFLTNDSPCGRYLGCDDAFIVFANGQTTIEIFFGEFLPLLPFQVAPAGTGFRLAAVPKTSYALLPTSGAWSMRVGVYQDYDDTISSGLLVDNIRQLREIPEPNSLLLVAAGVLGFALLSRRKQVALTGIAATRRRRPAAPTT